jgi:DinB superfamily
MTSETLALLDADRRALLAAVERLSEADRERRPAERCWSAAEILEHLASVEHAVARSIAIRGREPVPSNQPPPVAMAAERMAQLRVRARRSGAGHAAPASGGVKGPRGRTPPDLIRDELQASSSGFPAVFTTGRMNNVC